ncbi:MAG TPA: hypothetical protein VLX92_17115 [Kofleriaceae bacterium]|nr:hypothetical protein [Kofleriaceae bacterium]
MVVSLVVLGTLTKLAFAVIATHHTRAWWLPGAVAIALGAVACAHYAPARAVGAVAIVLGALAIAVACRLRSRVASRA